MTNFYGSRIFEKKMFLALKLKNVFGGFFLKHYFEIVSKEPSKVFRLYFLLNEFMFKMFCYKNSMFSEQKEQF